jgi:uncharacterized membrane protein
MIAAILFEFPAAWLLVCSLLVLLVIVAWRQHQRALAWSRVGSLFAFRFIASVLLIFLAARPVRVRPGHLAAAERPVIVLLDSSESMSLRDSGGSTRYERGLDFLSRRLLPAFSSAGLPVQAVLFDQAARFARGSELTATHPDGKRTNLGGAIAQALESSSQPPLAVIALTDGIANDDTENARATSSLLETGAPFIGLGFGSDQGVETLSLRRWSGPVTVTPRTTFSLSAELELLNGDRPAAGDLLLFRDGQMLQKKVVPLKEGNRTWRESFQVTEPAQGIHSYSVQLVPPNVPNLTCAGMQASTSVRVCDEQEVRVLYVQGALTWDFKFIGLALRKDPTLKITGLTRTSQQSTFRQNVEGAGELTNGFPESLDQLTPFRVLVLSNLRPADLSPAQQDLIGRFCSELGGGVLMIGGSVTFDPSWQNTKLERMLPVLLSTTPAGQNSAHPSKLSLTGDAQKSSVFQLSQDGSSPQLWGQLPSFSEFAAVDSAKLGAQVWMVSSDPAGAARPRIVMASQRYGAGISAVLGVQNFWRWRLAKDADPAQFDRFWKQLFRWLGEVGRQEVNIELSDQPLYPQQEVGVLLELQTSPQTSSETNKQFLVQALDGRRRVIREESLELEPSRQGEFHFRPPKPDLYTVQVLNAARSVVASRPVEVRETNIELAQTARNMETLQQWASVSDGLAFKVEDCPSPTDLVTQIKAKVQEVKRAQQIRQITGLNWMTLSLVLACLSGEWLLRKRWTLS